MKTLILFIFLFLFNQLILTVKTEDIYLEQNSGPNWDFSTCQRDKSFSVYLTYDRSIIKNINVAAGGAPHPPIGFINIYEWMNYSLIHTFTFDQTNRKFLIVISNELKSIYTINILNRTKIEQMENKNDYEMDELAVEQVTGNLYFVSNEDGIGICKPDMSYCKIIIPSKSTGHQLKNLLIHSQLGNLYWIKIEQNISTIQMSSMDGTNIQTFGNFRAILISLDVLNNDIYIVEGNGIVKKNLKTNEIINYLPSSNILQVYYVNCYLFYSERSQPNGDKKSTTFNSVDFEKRNMRMLYYFPYDVNFVFASDFVVGEGSNQNPCSTKRCLKEEICTLHQIDANNPVQNGVCLHENSVKLSVENNEKLNIFQEKENGLSIKWIFIWISCALLMCGFIWILRQKIWALFENVQKRLRRHSNSHLNTPQNQVFHFSTKKETVNAISAEENLEIIDVKNRF